MGIYVFTNNSNPLYIHNSLDNFQKNYEGKIKDLDQKGKQVLLTSIRNQKQKEFYIYDTLGVKQGDWIALSRKIFGVVEDEDPNKVQDRVEFFMKAFTSFIKEEVLSGVKVGEKAFQKRNKENDLKEYKNFITNYIRIFNDPIQNFMKWYSNNSNFYKEGVLTEDNIKGISKVFEEWRSKEKNKAFTDSNGFWNENIVLNSLEEANGLLDRSFGVISNMIGDIKEVASTGFVKYSDVLFGSENTSYWEETGASERLKENNRKFYQKIENDINKELEQLNFNLGTEDGKFHFSSSLNTNLKADDFFYFSADVDYDLSMASGISDKASWGKTLSDTKVHTGSFSSLLENLFKSWFSVGITAEIIRFLEYGIINSMGVGQFLKENIYYRQLEDFFFRVIDYYSYQWLTGGQGPFTHADFISVYKNTTQKHYFVPMSFILENIFNFVNQKNPNWSKDFFSLDSETKGASLFPIYTPIKKETLSDIGKDKEKEDYKLMIDTAKGIIYNPMNKGKVMLKWSRVSKIIGADK